MSYQDIDQAPLSPGVLDAAIVAQARKTAQLRMELETAERVLIYLLNKASEEIGEMPDGVDLVGYSSAQLVAN